MRYRNRLVFFIMLSGYFEDCLLSRFALRLALVVAAYSPGVMALMAASSRYRSPVTELFLPILVRQVFLPRRIRLYFGFCINFEILNRAPGNAEQAPELFEMANRQTPCAILPRPI